MRRMLFAAAVFFGLAANAHAMEVHVGGQLGYSWGESDVNIPEYPSTFDMDVEGYVVGAFAGVDWPVGSSGWEVGVEGDANWTDADGSNPSDGGAELYVIEQNWSASVRGRASYDIAPATELYVAAGVTWTEIETSYSPSAGGTDDDVLQGWTIAAGVDHTFHGNMFGRAEVRHTDYDDEGFFHLGPSSADLAATSLLIGVGWTF